MTKPNIWHKTNPNVSYRKAFLATTWPRNWLRLRPDQPFLVLKVHLSSVPFSTPFPQPQKLFFETAKLPPNIWFDTNGRLKQFSATQMSASATSQISSDPQLNILQPYWTKVLAIFLHSFPRRSWQKELRLKLSWSSSLQLAVWSINFSLSVLCKFHSFIQWQATQLGGQRNSFGAFLWESCDE